MLFRCTTDLRTPQSASSRCQGHGRWLWFCRGRGGGGAEVSHRTEAGGSRKTGFWQSSRAAGRPTSRADRSRPVDWHRQSACQPSRERHKARAPACRAFALYSRCIRASFAPHSGCIRAAFAPHSRRIRAAFAPHSRCIHAAFGQHPQPERKRDEV